MRSLGKYRSYDEWRLAYPPEWDVDEDAPDDGDIMDDKYEERRLKED
jgi:hypothetical protein